MLLASVFQRTFTTLALGLAGLNVQAQTVLPLETRSLYLQAGVDQQSTRAWTVGLTLPWADWQRTWGGGTWRGHWDLYASQWTSDGYTGRVHSTVLGIGPALRLRPDGGHGPWFVEGGMGASYASPRFVTRYKEMSTRLNFVSHLAVGFNHGEEHQHEWQLRLQHSSNGGIKKPNPGQNYLQLRYALHF